MKNLLIALLIGILAFNCLGWVAQHWFGFAMLWDHASMDWMESTAVFTIGAVLMVLIGFVVALSVIGGLLLAGLFVLGALIFAGASLFWPVLVLFAVIWLITRRNNTYPSGS